MGNCKLMRPIFHENMFNREGWRIKAVHERTVSNGTETYPLWRAVRKSEPNFSWVDNDRYLLYAEINGYLIPLGMTNYELIYSCGSKPVEKKLYGGQKERSRYYDSLRESGGEQAVLAELDKEWAEIVKCGSDPACQAEYIQKTLAKHTETYLEAKENGGTTFPDFIGALILDDLDRCMELSPIYQKNRRQREQARAVQDAEKNRIFCEEQNSAAKGIGALYARQGITLTNLIDGGAQERGKRAGTENVPAIAGMAAALEEACAHMAESTAKVATLRDRLIEGLSKIPHATLNGDPVNRLPGNVSFSFEGIEGESLILLLDDKGICASTGSACSSSSMDPSHVLLAIGQPPELAHGVLRVSLSVDNTVAEVDAILMAVREAVSFLRTNHLPLQKAAMEKFIPQTPHST